MDSLKETADGKAGAEHSPASRLADFFPAWPSLGLTAHARGKTAEETSVQNTLFSGAGTDAKPAWSDTMRGRAAIRLFSRGILGAGMFAIGSRISRKQMLDYSPEQFSITQAWEEGKPLQIIAKGFDVAFGKPIAQMTRAVNRTLGKTVAETEVAAWNAVNFRTKGYFHSIDGVVNAKGNPANARSLGAEVVSITFDFAMSSVGDASGRNLIQMIDPNIRKTWRVNDQGIMAGVGEKSHIDYGKMAKSVGKSAWKVFSNNQGEDWVAAVPYVYQMKLQRGLMTRVFRQDMKGAKLVFDNAWNGGAYKINNQGQIIGDYQLAGAVDLHARFVGYNVYTLMFREAYDHVGAVFDHWKQNGYSMHLKAPSDLNPLHGIKNATRYVIKSAIKANLYMNPATVPFWLFRTPQTKWRGALIDPEAGHGVNAIASEISFDERVTKALEKQGLPASEFAAMKAKMTQVNGLETIQNYVTADHRIMPANHGPEHMWLGNRKLTNPIAKLSPYDAETYEHYKPGFGKLFSQFLNPFGRFSYNLGSKATALANKLPEGAMRRFLADSPVAGASTESFMRTFVDASVSYTPYMFAKAETAMRVDDRKKDGTAGKMDKAIYKLIDNVAGFHAHGAAGAVKEIFQLASRSPEDRHADKLAQQKEDETLETLPATTVQPEGRQVDASGVAPSDRRDVEGAKDKEDRRWAETVAGRSLAAQFQPASPQTRH